jgi:DNA helicase-2/ATP-dependent DNA helicase PcrA
MNESILMNPAELAAEIALSSIYECIESNKSFLLEAGAGAGKTYSLIKALKYVIKKQGRKLLLCQQQIACITYTNVASNEINSRTDGHPVIHSSTIHAFCWSLIKGFQPLLRENIPMLKNWADRLVEVGNIGNRKINYDHGYPKVYDDSIELGHDDVISLMVLFMAKSKFRKLFIARFPILFIDEYQDTNKEFIDSLKTHFLDMNEGLIIGFFGDHWQKIYKDGCGEINHPYLRIIEKKANFRSYKTIVEILNRIRPKLDQAVRDPDSNGFIKIFHTNNWQGERRTEQHWVGDLPAEIAHNYLEATIGHLVNDRWNFNPIDTKILMLTHNVLLNKVIKGLLMSLIETSHLLKRKIPI